MEDNKNIIGLGDFKGHNLLKSYVNNDIEKGGEGSRGGKVIGHTKSGKPVYESSKENEQYKPTDDELRHYGESSYKPNKHLLITQNGQYIYSYSQMTPKDHLDAAEHHDQQNKKAMSQRGKKANDPHDIGAYALAGIHSNEAYKHRQYAYKKQKLEAKAHHTKGQELNIQAQNAKGGDKIRLGKQADEHFNEYAKSLSDRDLKIHHKNSSVGSREQSIYAAHLHKRANEKSGDEHDKNRGEGNKPKSTTIDNAKDQLSKALDSIEDLSQEIIEKASHNYFKREGTPGNYKYYYSEQAHKDSKAGKKTSDTVGNDLFHDQIKGVMKKKNMSHEEALAWVNKRNEGDGNHPSHVYGEFLSDDDDDLSTLGTPEHKHFQAHDDTDHKSKMEKSVTLSDKEFKEEHEKLIPTLKTGSKQEREKEAKEQEKELEDKIEKSSHKTHKYLRIENGKYIYDESKMSAKDHKDAADLHHDLSNTNEGSLTSKHDNLKESKYHKDLRNHHSKLAQEKSKMKNSNLEKSLDFISDISQDLEKAGMHKYFKREGTEGNYKYYYTQEQYESEHSRDPKTNEKTSHVIGKTKSGKEIYETPVLNGVPEHVATYSKDDHKEAADLHKKIADDYKRRADEDNGSNGEGYKKKMENLHNHHLTQHNFHKDKVKHLANKEKEEAETKKYIGSDQQKLDRAFAWNRKEASTEDESKMSWKDHDAKSTQHAELAQKYHHSGDKEKSDFHREESTRHFKLSSQKEKESAQQLIDKNKDLIENYNKDISQKTKGKIKKLIDSYLPDFNRIESIKDNMKIEENAFKNSSKFTYDTTNFDSYDYSLTSGLHGKIADAIEADVRKNLPKEIEENLSNIIINEKIIPQMLKNNKEYQFHNNLSKKLRKESQENFDKGKYKLEKSLDFITDLSQELDDDIEKGNHKYFKREGTKGSYKYYYTEAEYNKAKGVNKESSFKHSDNNKEHLNNLKTTVTKESDERLNIALRDLKANKEKYQSSASREENEYNISQIEIIEAELKNRKSGGKGHKEDPIEAHKNRGFDESKGDVDVTGQSETIPKEDVHQKKYNDAQKEIDKIHQEFSTEQQKLNNDYNSALNHYRTKFPSISGHTEESYKKAHEEWNNEYNRILNEYNTNVNSLNSSVQEKLKPFREIQSQSISDHFKSKEKESDSKFKIGTTVSLASDVNLVSLSDLKNQKLKVVGTVKTGLISQPVFLKVVDESGKEHEISPSYVDLK